MPIYPDQRIILEGTKENPTEMRIAHLVTPIGLGQRGLIDAPPRTAKTVLLHMLAKSIVRSCPKAHLVIFLVDERPEEVPDFQRSFGAARDVEHGGSLPILGTALIETGLKLDEVILEEIGRVWALRKVFTELDPVVAAETLLAKLDTTRVNGEVLMTIGD